MRITNTGQITDKILVIIESIIGKFEHIKRVTEKIHLTIRAVREEEKREKKPYPIRYIDDQLKLSIKFFLTPPYLKMTTQELAQYFEHLNYSDLSEGLDTKHILKIISPENQEVHTTYRNYLHEFIRYVRDHSQITRNILVKHVTQEELSQLNFLCMPLFNLYHILEINNQHPPPLTEKNPKEIKVNIATIAATLPGLAELFQDRKRGNNPRPLTRDEQDAIKKLIKCKDKLQIAYLQESCQGLSAYGRGFIKYHAYKNPWVAHFIDALKQNNSYYNPITMQINHIKKISKNSSSLYSLLCGGKDSEINAYEELAKFSREELILFTLLEPPETMQLISPLVHESESIEIINRHLLPILNRLNANEKLSVCQSQQSKSEIEAKLQPSKEDRLIEYASTSLSIKIIKLVSVQLDKLIGMELHRVKIETMRSKWIASLVSRIIKKMSRLQTKLEIKALADTFRGVAGIKSLYSQTPSKLTREEATLIETELHKLEDKHKKCLCSFIEMPKILTLLLTPSEPWIAYLIITLEYNEILPIVQNFLQNPGTKTLALSPQKKLSPSSHPNLFSNSTSNQTNSSYNSDTDTDYSEWSESEWDEMKQNTINLD